MGQDSNRSYCVAPDSKGESWGQSEMFLVARGVLTKKSTCLEYQNHPTLPVRGGEGDGEETHDEQVAKEPEIGRHL